LRQRRAVMPGQEIEKAGKTNNFKAAFEPPSLRRHNGVVIHPRVVLQLNALGKSRKLLQRRSTFLRNVMKDGNEK